MSTVKFSERPKGFEILPEGVTTLHVSDVKRLPRTGEPQVVTAEMVDAKGRGFYGKYPQKYDLTVDGGRAAFYYLVLNGYGVDIVEEPFDLDEMEDTFIEVEVFHKEGSKGGTFANIRVLGEGQPFEVGNTKDTSDEDDEEYA